MCEQHSRSLLLCLWFLFVSHLSNFLSHPSVPGPRNLVNKQAPETSREPATSWKSEAMRLSTKTLSFQEGMTESEQRPWLPMSPRPTFPTLALSALHPSCPKLCPSSLAQAHLALGMCLRTFCVHKAGLSQASAPALRRMPIRKLSYFENVKSSILMEPFSSPSRRM